MQALAKAGLGLSDCQVLITIKIQTENQLLLKVISIKFPLNTKHIFKVFELHEAFAGQVLSNLKAMESEKFCQEKLALNQKVPKG